MIVFCILALKSHLLIRGRDRRVKGPQTLALGWHAILNRSVDDSNSKRLTWHTRCRNLGEEGGHAIGLLSKK